MQRHIISTVLITLFSVFSFTVNAQDHGHEEHGDQAHATEAHDAHSDAAHHEGENNPEANKEFINHHLLDAHDFHITDGVSFPLPVMLWDGGLTFFMSSEFHHDDNATVVVEKNGKRYTKFHSKIYYASETANAHGQYVEMDETHHATNEMPLDMSITKNVFVVILMSIFMIWVFGGIAKSYKKSPVPSGAGKFLEPIIVFVRDEIAIPNIGEKHYKKYMSYLLTIFFFIWFINLFGMFPLGINVTGNIAVTASLAILTLILTLFTGKKDYWMHIFWMPGVPVPMKIILMPIEILGVFIKPFALMIRLYANMKAGHVVLMSLIAVMYAFSNWGAKGAFFGLTFALSLLELLVAALQAYIFTMLSALYFGSASEEHGDH
ncbi:MAG: F0F1 ATP synthase subunit A [Schleiferiaceae bacterium]|jgi:F-type H+-transporting ATPase subunit a|nr:F0F1 ATP synthase subunit A [Schleiferiaceae bacterium]